jgi:hypothetical protein
VAKNDKSIRPSKTLVITNGKGRLFMQTLLPLSAELKAYQGDNLYTYGGQSHPPKFSTGPEAECRLEISPSKPQSLDLFLHVLTAADAGVNEVPTASAIVGKDSVSVMVGKAKIDFGISKLGGSVAIGAKKTKLDHNVK